MTQLEKSLINHPKKALQVSVVGATGLVGQILLNSLGSRAFPVKQWKLFGSKPGNSAWGPIELLRPGCFENQDMVFFDAPESVSLEWAFPAAEAGAWVIDHSSAFRMDPAGLLLIPEVNLHRLEDHLKRYRKDPNHFPIRDRILSGPNCVVVPLAVVLKHLNERWKIKRVVIATYQSVSGAGQKGLQALLGETQDFLINKVEKNQPLEGCVSPQIPLRDSHSPFPAPIAFECIPQIGSLDAEGWSTEETKIVFELRKLLELPHLSVAAVAVRVPQLYCHGQAVFVEFLDSPGQEPLEIAEVGHQFDHMPGVKRLTAEKGYPLSRQCVGTDWIWVGRLRKDPSVDSGISFWLMTDNLRKGAALNAIQIAESLLERV